MVKESPFTYLIYYKKAFKSRKISFIFNLQSFSGHLFFPMEKCPKFPQLKKCRAKNSFMVCNFLYSRAAAGIPNSSLKLLSTQIQEFIFQHKWKIISHLQWECIFILYFENKSVWMFWFNNSPLSFIQRGVQNKTNYLLILLLK